MGEGPLGPLKLHLVAKVQFCRFTTGPDLSKRALFLKGSLPSPNVEKCDQEESAWARVPMPPKITLGCQFTTGPSLSKRGLFLKASLPSPNVEKCDHEESAWARVPMPPKTTLGCKSSILSIHDRSVPVEPRPFFKAALPSPECREM